jgi:hypothetical protein
MLTIKILDKDSNTRFVEHGVEEVSLVNTSGYSDGDSIAVEIGKQQGFYHVQLDESLGESMVYLTDDLHFTVPFGEKHISYPPTAFSDCRHLLTVRKATAEEIGQYRNLAFNVNDQHGDTHCYPHATANVETRGESVFAARNAIDGIVANHSHGEWPYQSWGINRRDDATFKLDFGRTVEIDKIVIYERADFPHDNWWKEITIEYSDGEIAKYPMVKTDQGQTIELEKKQVEWLELKNLIKSDEPSPFPALAQIKVFGRDITV